MIDFLLIFLVRIVMNDIVFIVVTDDLLGTSTLWLFLRVVEGRIIGVITVEIIIVFFFLWLCLNLKIDLIEEVLLDTNLWEYLMRTNHLSVQGIVLYFLIAEPEISK